MEKRRVALLFGGRSSEHSISCATAGGVMKAIESDRYEVIPIGVTRSGAFVLEHNDPARFTLNPEQLPAVIDNGSRIIWPDSVDSRELRVHDTAGERSLGVIDVVFPILHGRFGEDGTVQGLLELTGLPYVGNGVLASAIGMDKHMTKVVLQAADIKVAPWITLRSPYEASSENPRIKALGLPVFVKPARAGSSVGVTKVSDWAELAAALRVAFAEDRTVLVEKALVGREIEVAVLQSRDGAIQVSVAGEVIVTGRDFYDFEAKYLAAPGVELVCPAKLSAQELTDLQDVARRAFAAMDGEGLARVDVFYTGGEFVVNEVNTMPGFTPISMFPTCWQQTGLGYSALITELIETGIARGSR